MGQKTRITNREPCLDTDPKAYVAWHNATKSYNLYSMKLSSIMIAHVFGGIGVGRLRTLRLRTALHSSAGQRASITVSLAERLISYHTLVDLRLQPSNSTSKQHTYCVPQRKLELVSNGVGTGERCVTLRTLN